MKVILNRNIPTEVSEYFIASKFEVIYTNSNGAVSDIVGYHPDIQCSLINGTLITSHYHFDYYKKYAEKIIVSEKELCSPYPSDVLFNCFRLGNTIYGNEKYLDNNLKRLIKKNNLDFYHINQGYSNCSSLAVSENAVMTSDKGMEKAFLKNKADVLLIDNKTIKLEGCDYGFIGGAACKFENKIIFFGSIKNHTDFKDIDVFLQKYNIIYKDFSFPLEDFGSALFFE